MARSYKIKRYRRIYRPSIGKIVFRWVMSGLALVAVFVLGWKLYDPFAQWMEQHQNKNETINEQEEKQDTEIKEEATMKEPSVSMENSTLKQETTVEQLPFVDIEAKQTRFLPEDTLFDSQALASALETAKADGMDSVMIDLKNQDGWLIYPIQYKEGYDDYFTGNPTLSLEKLVKQIQAAGLKPIASIHTFRDRRFQQAETYAGILYEGSESFWLDNAPDAGGRPWLNPYSPLARDYICKLIQDAAKAGFRELVLQDFGFPIGYSMDKMKFVYDEGQSKQDCLKDAEAVFRSCAEEVGVELWIAYPAASWDDTDSAAYGGSVADIWNENCMLNFSGMTAEEIQQVFSMLPEQKDRAVLIDGEEQRALLSSLPVERYIVIE